MGLTLMGGVVAVVVVVVGHQDQCDQMAILLLFNLWPFSTMKIYLVALKFQSWCKSLTNTN